MVRINQLKEMDMKAEKKNFVLECMIAVSFVMSVFSNVISFYLTGNTDVFLRKGISWGLIFLFTAFLVIYVIRTFLIVDNTVKRRIVISMLPLFINGLILLIGLVITDQKVTVLKQCISFGAYCVPIVCGAIYVLVEDKFESLILKFKYIALVMLPFYFLTIIHLFSLTPLTESKEGFGGLAYLLIGYSAVTIYACLICDLILYFVNETKKLIRLGLVVLEIITCCLIVILAGSRGALLAWICVTLLAVIYLVIKKQKKPMYGMGCGVAAIIIFCIVAPADNMALNRQFALIAELKSGGLQQSLSSEEGNQFLNEMYENAEEGVGFADYAVNKREELSQGEQPQIEERYSEVVHSVTNGSMARLYLWQLAIKEMLNNPISGGGILAYQLKYKMYPHNILFECMADFGLLIFAVFIFLCVAIFISLLKYSIKSWKYSCMIIIVSGPMIQAMLSGELYVCPFLLFTFTIVIWLWTQKRKCSVVESE